MQMSTFQWTILHTEIDSFTLKPECCGRIRACHERALKLFQLKQLVTERLPQSHQTVSDRFGHTKLQGGLSFFPAFEAIGGFKIIVTQ